MPVSSFDGINQFDGGDDVTDDDDDDRDLGIVQPNVMSDYGSIPQFDGAGDLIELDTPPKTTTTPLAPGGTSVLTGIVYLYFSVCSWIFFFMICFWFWFLMTLWVCLCDSHLISVQAQVHASDFRKRVRIDSWNSESPELEVVEKPPSPKRARIDHQPGPPVTRLVGRSRTLSSSSTFSMTDSHGSTPSVDSGFGRGFDVSRNLITSPMVMQVCVVFVSLFVFFVRSVLCVLCVLL